MKNHLYTKETEVKKEITKEEIDKHLKEYKETDIGKAKYIHETLGENLPDNVKSYLKQKHDELAPKIQEKYKEWIDKKDYNKVFEMELATGIPIAPDNLDALIELAEAYEKEGRIEDAKEIRKDLGKGYTKKIKKDSSL